MSEAWIIAIVSIIITSIIIPVITHIYKKNKSKIKKWKHNKRLKKEEKIMNKLKKWKVALKIKQTGLIYQRGVVLCSKKKLAKIKLSFQLNNFISGHLLQNLFTKEELLEYSEEVTYDCWEDSEFDWILEL